MIKDHVTIFAHGLGGWAGSGQRLYKDIIGGKIIGENGPEWGASRQTCLAQDADIDIVVKQIEKHTEKNMTLSGISKGAATMVNTVGTLAQKKPSLLKNVQAVIVDSPFTSPESVAYNVIRSKFPSFFDTFVTWSLTTTPIKFMTTLALKKFYPGYDPTKITPLKAVQELWQHVDRNMVIVIIHSQKDALINVNDSRILYLELKKLGFNNLYFIETTEGAHGKAHWGSENKVVAHALNLIYLKHNLPLPVSVKELNNKILLDAFEKSKQNPQEHEAFFAELSKIQPSIEDVHKKIYPQFSSTCSLSS